MLLLRHRQELLIGCGNNVRILHIGELLLDEEVLEVGSQEDQVVQGMTSHGDMVWCFTEASSYIVQFDLSKRNQVARFYCSSTVVTKGHCLAESSPTTPTIPISPSPEEPPFRGRARAMTSRPGPKNLKDTLERRARFATRRQRSRSVGDSSENYIVTSLITVKDTLWIGRADGNILVVGIDSTSERYKVGQVLAILSPHAIMDLSQGPVSKLFLVAPNRVVACRDIKSEESPIRKLSGDNTKPSAHTGRTQNISLKPRPYRHQLLVWEDWGSEELRQFEATHLVCNY